MQGGRGGERKGGEEVSDTGDISGVQVFRLKTESWRRNDREFLRSPQGKKSDKSDRDSH